jgi:hypothetical protein
LSAYELIAKGLTRKSGNYILIKMTEAATNQIKALD